MSETNHPDLGAAARKGARFLAKASLRHLPLKRQLFAIARGLHPPRALYKRLPVEGPFRVTTGDGASFRLFGHERPTETELFWGGVEGYDERESLRCWMRLSRSASVIVDVGAYIGIYSLVAAAVNPRARVVGFEPVSRNFEAFEANCALNATNVTPIRAAVGDRDGFADLFLSEDLMIASLGRSQGSVQERVPVCTLKTWFRDNSLDQLDLMKIDVETFEPAVLAGMGDLLGRCRPSIIVEVLNDDVGQTLETLCRPQYEFFHIDESRGLIRSDHLRRINRESRNYLLCTETVARSLGAA